MKRYLQGLNYLPSVLTKLEKLVLSLIGMSIIVTSLLWWQSALAKWSVVPIAGGTYREGITDQDPAQLDFLVTKLTKLGLTYINSKSEVAPALASRWEISPDGKKYTFYLREHVSAKDIAGVYNGLPNWSNITTEVGENNTIVMTLKQPFSPLLAFVSEPVIEAGPYKLEKRTRAEVALTANKEFVLGEPYIQRIILTIYPDSRVAKSALARQEVMGVDTLITGVPAMITHELKLSKQTALLFNLEKPIFKDKQIRERIKSKQPLENPLNAVLVTTQEPELLRLANQFAEVAKTLNLNISIRSYNPITLEKDVLQKEDYDLVLTTLNYGYDHDPYPYWHSSQIVEDGQNYAGYNNKEADKLIEQARQTLDLGERQKLYDQFDKLLEADIPGIFYPINNYQYTVSQRVKGIEDGLGAVPADRYNSVWHWYFKSRRARN